ncbi:hypothetical protein EK21DRAFT_89216 [Setomelanomma holmii]|uniref:SNF2 N-terminal domain-containing protein n=1 Tax=Setomelanomma holmii TaxID=210430 RepID=A0A9P4HAP9_9PLEO|nr:hypothetical protein EK21DRAFT_89216 [Setomelanomma holmii]
MSSLNQSLSTGKDTSADDASELDGPPLTSLKLITKKEVDEYHERNKWVDNPAYQPQNHEEACDGLGIANPDQPRMNGLLGTLTFDAHQPTGIWTMVGFEDSCVGGGLNGEDVGLGKTVEVIGLLLFRSNQRCEQIKRGDTVPKALPSILVMPPNLIPQWRDEIQKFTDRLTTVVYYGAARNGTVWFQQRRNADKDLTKKAAERQLAEEFYVYTEVYTECPHQLSGLFDRVILDEGHEVRHESEEIGTTVVNLKGRYRHIITVTPAFNNLQEFSGLMVFLQNPKLHDAAYLESFRFTAAEISGVNTSKKGTGIAPLDAVLWQFNPYEVTDDHPKAPLKYCKKTKNAKSVEWNTTTYRKLCLLSSWLGFLYLLNYKASKLSSLRKKKDALTILRDLRTFQKRKGIPDGQQIPVNASADRKDVQQILRYHCTGSPKLRVLLIILAELVVLREEKVLIWVNTPAQSEWLFHVLRFCGIDAAQLRTDLRQREQDNLLYKFNIEFQAGRRPHLLIMCRTTIEFEPPSNEAVRVQEVGRVKRKGCYSSWVRHISLPTKDSFNTKQDSQAILKNLPNLLTQLDMEVWGKKDDTDNDHELGDFVLFDDKLYPVDAEEVQGKKLDVLDADNLLYHISMQLLGRKAAAEDKRGKYEEFAEMSPLWE